MTRKMTLLLLVLAGLLCVGLRAEEVTVGSGADLASVPVDMYYRNSLFECLFYNGDLGFENGTITALKFYNSFVSDLSNKPIRIWLGGTTLTNLSAGWIPSSQLTLVYDGAVNFPSGSNIIDIPLPVPYTYTGGILAMLVQRPMDGNFYSVSDRFQAQTVGTIRARKAQSDSNVLDPANPSAPGTVSGTFPQTTFVYSLTALANDLVCESVSGDQSPSVGNPTAYQVRIRNNGSQSQSVYSVRLMKQGGVELASLPGQSIAPQQTLDLSLEWTPDLAGPTSIYARVELAGDQALLNNQSLSLDLNVQPEGTYSVTVGSGNENARLPIDFYHSASLCETIFLAPEINTNGLLHGIKLYNNFIVNIPYQLIYIWMGETNLADLSSGWVSANALSLVFSGTVDFPAGHNEIVINFTAPFHYAGGNLVMMIEHPPGSQYSVNENYFATQSGGLGPRSRMVSGSGIDYNPDNPPAAPTTPSFPKTSFLFIDNGLGSLSGTVYGPNGLGLGGATVNVIGNSLSCLTSINGSYSFPHVSAGSYQVRAQKHGYESEDLPVTIMEDQASILDFNLDALPSVNVTGRVVVNGDPNSGIAGAGVTLEGFYNYQTLTDGLGYFSFPAVIQNHSYQYDVSKTGYQNATGVIAVGTQDLNMGNIMLIEIAYPPSDVMASIAGGQVNLSWTGPAAVNGQWVHYDNGANLTAIGMGGVANFDVAVRYPASALVPYTGMSLRAVRVWVASEGNFTIKVWRGGSSAQPGQLWTTQIFTPVLDAWTTVILSNPVPVTGQEELWFGYNCNVYSGFPAGCDSGPVADGLGNLICIQNAWGTLLQLSDQLHYNWNIQGYLSFTGFPEAVGNAPQISKGTEAPSGRSLNGYQVWRLAQGQESNEQLWTLLTPEPVTSTSFIDSGWGQLEDGIWTWAVKARYSGGVYSLPAFSNGLAMYNQSGFIAGLVRSEYALPIQGASVTCGPVTVSTDANGAFSILVPSGTYSVTASHPQYVPVTQSGVQVTVGNTTTLYFALNGAQTLFSDGFEDYSSWSLNFPPWMTVDHDLSPTYSLPATVWPHINEPQAFIVFCPVGAVPPAGSVIPHGGIMVAACFASTDGPNDDWLISPQLNGVTRFSFWAKSHNSQYGLERFKLAVSTTGPVPTDFVAISGPDPIEVPTVWTRYEYDLSSYGNTYIRVGINCVSDDAMALFIDDVSFIGQAVQGFSQNINLSSGWNLVSLNVAPVDHSVAALISEIAGSVVQIKGSEGVYIPGNPYNTLNQFTDGRAYSIKMLSPAVWEVSGNQLSLATNIVLNQGWNLAAYLPQQSMPASTATQGIADWLLEMKGTQGIYIPGNPYNTLTSMQPGQGYWMKLSEPRVFNYPNPQPSQSSPGQADKDGEPVVLPSSMTVLARCDFASEGDILQAWVGDELRGQETLIAPEAFAACLIQIYTEIPGEQVRFRIIAPEGELPVQTVIYSLPGSSLGEYPQFVVLEAGSSGSADEIPIPTRLNAVWPNPFNPSAQIGFSVGSDNLPLRINVYNLRGQKVITLADQSYAKGSHSVCWDGRDAHGKPVSSGVYIIELQSPGIRMSAKAVLAK